MHVSKELFHFLRITILGEVIKKVIDGMVLPQ